MGLHVRYAHMPMKGGSVRTREFDDGGGGTVSAWIISSVTSCVVDESGGGEHDVTKLSICSINKRDPESRKKIRTDLFLEAGINLEQQLGCRPKRQ